MHRVAGSRRALLTAALLLGVGLAVLVGPLASAREPSRPPEGVGASSPAIGGGPGRSGDAAWRRGTRREKARIAKLGTKEAKAARRRSRLRYRKLRQDEAIRLARREFADQLRNPLFDGDRPDGATKVEEQRDGGTAVAEDADGTKSLLSSSLPLEAKTESGQEAPVDLSLTTDGAMLEPVTSVAPFQIAKRSAAELEFPELGGLSFEFKGAEERTAEVVGDRAFFASVERDTDAAITPLPTGAEIDLQVRSVESPERFIIDVDLPEGAKLRRARVPAAEQIPNDPPRALEVVRRGRPLAYIYPPTAHDADLRTVRTSMKIDDQDIVVNVDHKDRDVKYPLLVDPEVNSYSDNRYAWDGWAWTQVLYRGSAGFGSARNDPRYYAGLYQSHPSNTFITDGSHGYWYFRAPVNTFLYRVQFGGIGHESIPYGNRNHTNFFNGIMKGDFSTWEPNVSHANPFGSPGGNPFGPAEHNTWGQEHDFCFTPRCNRRAPATEQNFAMLGLQTDNKFDNNGVNSGGFVAKNTLAWANVYFGDNRLPSLTGALPGSTNWRDDGGGETAFTVGARDDGLGIHSFTLNGAASGGGRQTLGCTGNPYYLPCASQTSRTFRYRLAEGIRPMSVSALDAVDNSTAVHQWQERVDRSPPSIAVPTGGLWDARNRSDDQRFAGLYDDAYGVSVQATDAHSGVRDVEIFMARSGGQKESQRGRGGYATGGNLNWTLRPDDYADGEYTVEVVARDNVQGQGGAPDDRHISTRSFPVTIDRRGDVYSASQHNGDPSDARTVEARDWGRYGTAVGRMEDEDIVETRAIVPCDEDAPDGAKCAETRQQPNSALGQPLPAIATERSTEPDDRRLILPSITVDIARSDYGNPVARGPLASALLPSQTPPPARGAEYLRYDGTTTELAQGDNGDPAAAPADTDDPDGPARPAEEVEVTTQLFLDSRTRLPLRQRIVSANGFEQNLYWTYARSRLEGAELPADFFRLGRPSAPEADEETSFTGAAPVGPTQDAATGRPFTPRYLGPTFTTGGKSFCLATGMRYNRIERTDPAVEDFDPDATERDLSRITQAHAEYNETTPGGTCVPGAGDIDDPDFEVLTYHRDSPQAAELREQFRTGAEATQADPTYGDFVRGGIQPVLFELQPPVAYLMPISSTVNSALFDIGDTTIRLRGTFEKSDLNALVANLRVF